MRKIMIPDAFLNHPAWGDKATWAMQLLAEDRRETLSHQHLPEDSYIAGHDHWLQAAATIMLSFLNPEDDFGPADDQTTLQDLVCITLLAGIELSDVDKAVLGEHCTSLVENTHTVWDAVTELSDPVLTGDVIGAALPEVQSVFYAYIRAASSVALAKKSAEDAKWLADFFLTALRRIEQGNHKLHLTAHEAALTLQNAAEQLLKDRRT